MIKKRKRDLTKYFRNVKINISRICCDMFINPSSVSSRFYFGGRLQRFALNPEKLDGSRKVC